MVNSNTGIDKCGYGIDYMGWCEDGIDPMSGWQEISK